MPLSSASREHERLWCQALRRARTSTTNIHAFQKSSLILLNKLDLLPYVDLTRTIRPGNPRPQPGRGHFLRIGQNGEASASLRMDQKPSVPFLRYPRKRVVQGVGFRPFFARPRARVASRAACATRAGSSHPGGGAQGCSGSVGAKSGKARRQAAESTLLRCAMPKRGVPKDAAFAILASLSVPKARSCRAVHRRMRDACASGARRGSALC